MGIWTMRTNLPSLGLFFSGAIRLPLWMLLKHKRISVTLLASLQQLFDFKVTSILSAELIRTPWLQHCSPSFELNPSPMNTLGPITRSNASDDSTCLSNPFLHLPYRLSREAFKYRIQIKICKICAADTNIIVYANCKWKIKIENGVKTG